MTSNHCIHVLKNITKTEQKLINKTIEVVKESYNTDLHTVSCGILTTKNEMFFGINCKGPVVSICAEPGALSSMIVNNKKNKIKTIVAIKGKLVHKNLPSIIPPCGTCRELLRFNFPNAYAIILDGEDMPKKIKVKYLLPHPYVSVSKNKKTEEKAMTNEIWCCQGHQKKSTKKKTRKL